MNKDVLSQEEINALLNNEILNEDIKIDLSDKEKDIVGEVGNISMSTAATTLSSILNRKVSITTPRVSYVSFKQIIDECNIPKVVANIAFKEGLKGDNLLMMDIEDATIIADLMMGGDGLNIERAFTELELSAVGEAMNQMIGSASTSMATMLERPIDILPPNVEVWDKSKESDFVEVKDDRYVVRISFNLDVEGLIQSEIMQVYTIETVEEIVELMMPSGAPEEPVQIKAEVVSDELISETIQSQSTQSNDIIHTETPETKVSIKKPIFPNFEDEKPEQKPPRNLDLIMDVPLEFSVVLGKSKKTIKEILSFGNGSLVELNKLADEPLEIYVNGKLIAHGEVVVINENFGVRITNILSKEQRVKNL
ncbi:MAG: flagellar motor switch phosphatase FliY [Tissierella sp.]|nr:flagellar motor switch phosphatase FliY [Tissierella sp.]